MGEVYHLDVVAARMARARKYEIADAKRRPYRSMDDLPDITLRGQAAVHAIVFEPVRNYHDHH